MRRHKNRRGQIDGAMLRWPLDNLRAASHYVLPPAVCFLRRFLANPVCLEELVYQSVGEAPVAKSMDEAFCNVHIPRESDRGLECLEDD